MSPFRARRIEGSDAADRATTLVPATESANARLYHRDVGRGSVLVVQRVTHCVIVACVIFKTLSTLGDCDEVDHSTGGLSVAPIGMEL